MKKELKLRKAVLVSIYFGLVIILLVGTFITFSTLKSNKNNSEDINYVSNSILSNDTPVVSTEKQEDNKEKVLIKPYKNDNVKVGKYYYDYKAEATNQQNSIIFYEDSYMQNSGVDYILDDKFDIINVYDGEVIKVEESELLGNVVEIKHDNNVISVYQSLSDITVKKGDVVKQGEIIGKSGNSKINSELGNHLHFELYSNGEVVNPEESYNKAIDKI